jgi:hypothetical protein
VLLAAGLGGWQVIRLAGNSHHTANPPANAAGTQRGSVRQPTGGTATAGGGTGAAQRVDIHKTVWYGGKKFTLNTATYDRTASKPLQVDVSVENLAAKPDDSTSGTRVFFAVDGHITAGQLDGISTLPATSTVKGTLDFRPQQPIANLRSGSISIGDSDTAQAVVPLGDGAPVTTLEPKRVGGPATYTVGVLTFTVHYCELRGDFPARHIQAPSGSMLVVCDIDVKDNKNSIYDHGVWPTNFRLKLPDGTVVGPATQMWDDVDLNYNQQANDKPVGFTIRWPAPGAYGFQVLDAGRLGNDPPPPNGLAELPLTLA